MIILDKTLLSDELYSERFVCDLKACKGGCCVEGEAGAPLTEEETGILNKVLVKISPFMAPEGLAAIGQQGHWVVDRDGDLTTPLVGGKQCAYAFFDGDGVARCAIEKAFEAGLTGFRKPISCHLYPIRITEYPHYEALNYHRWPICKHARIKGKELNVRVVHFAREALVRKYGQKWYGELEEYIRLGLHED